MQKNSIRSKVLEGCRRAVSLVLGLVLAIGSCAGVLGGDAMATTRAADTNVEKVYTRDAFAEEYSSGYFRYYADGHSVGSGVVGSNGDYTGTNKSKNKDIYIDIYNGAVIDGVEYDVREYVWLDSNSGSNSWERKIGSTQETTAYYIYVTGAVKVYREFHIYKKGTLNSTNPIEVEFKGIMHFSDLDASEGYQIVQGYAGAWVMARTKLSYKGEYKWLGTEATTDADTASQIWVQVEGNANKPMVIMYETSQRRHTNIGFSSVTFYYTVNYPNGESETTSKQIAEYGTYTLTEAEWDGEDAANYEFSGWYEDANYTEEAEYTVTLITNDEHYYGAFKKIAAGVTTTVEHGKITAESTDSRMTSPGKTEIDAVTEQNFYGIRAGNEVTIQYEAEEGYELSSVTVDGREVSIADYPAEYKFYIDDKLEDHDIKVVYKLKSFRVETEVLGGEISESRELGYGEEYTVVYQPESDKYELIRVVVDGEEVSIEDYAEEYTFVATEDHEIFVEYGIKEYEIKTEVLGGEITEGGNVEWGDDYTIMFSPNEGYRLESVTVDGSVVEVSDGKYTFEDVKEDHEIKVVYKKEVFVVETEVVNGGITEGGNVEWGEDYAVEFSPNEGYELAEVLVDGISVEAEDSFDFLDVKGNHKIKVIYKKKKYIVETGVVNGEITEGREVEYGEDYLAKFLPNEGYGLVGIMVDGETVGILGGEESWAFRDIRENHEIFVRYQIKTFTVGTEVVNGEITEGGSVNYGENYVVSFSPEEGYELSEVIVNGTLVEVSDGKYTFEDVKEDHEIKVVYKKEVFVVETEVVNGEISEGGSVEWGEDYAVEFSPNEGYELAEVLVDGTLMNVSGDNYEFEDVKNNHEIKVVYKKKIYNIRTEVVNGEISEGGSVEWGDDYTVMFSPNEGYRLESVTVDGFVVEVSDGKYTFEDVKEDHEIKVVYKKEIFVVKTEVVNGEISEGGSVEWGEDYTVEFSPNEGYELAEVLVDGISVEVNGNVYQFDDIRENHKMTVKFVKIYVEPKPEPKIEEIEVIEPREMTMVIVGGVNTPVNVTPVRREASDWVNYDYFGYFGGGNGVVEEIGGLEETEVPVLGVNTEGGDCGGRCRIRLMDRLCRETIEAVIIAGVGMVIYGILRSKKEKFRQEENISSSTIKYRK